MKYLILLLTLLVSGLFAQDAMPKDGKKYHAIFEMSSGEAQRLEGVIRNMDNLKKALGPENVTVAIVLHGGAIVSFTKEKTALASEWERLSKSGIILLACGNSMKMRGIEKESLLPGVSMVDSAVAELVRKQQAGWQYLRNAN